MHDPMVVAWDIKLPIPLRQKWLEEINKTEARWTLGRRLRTNPENLGKPVYPWWNLNGYRPVVAGRIYNWYRFATVWHVEPDGRDSGTVCKHSIRWQDEDQKWHSKNAKSWKWHVHHWKIQIHFLQKLRRRLLTRCEYCGGRSTKTNPVNCTHHWDRKKTPWWRGELYLHHSGCTPKS